jgi:hypothetical protein
VTGGPLAGAVHDKLTSERPAAATSPAGAPGLVALRCLKGWTEVKVTVPAASPAAEPSETDIAPITSVPALPGSEADLNDARAADSDPLERGPPARLPASKAGQAANVAARNVPISARSHDRRRARSAESLPLGPGVIAGAFVDRITALLPVNSPCARMTRPAARTADNR